MTKALRQQVTEESAGSRQSRAANPLKSHWVGASAGTGKTKVLIDRVLRLMLPRPGLPRESATAPQKILCLTFTKTAAAEMSTRIYERLSEWSVMEDEKLDEALRDLTGEYPSREMHEEARRLFARVLDTPGGLRILTIHSFCQSVLKRFPVEAGLPPHFEMMDEQGAVDYLTRCLHDIIDAAREAPESMLASSFDMLARQMDSEGMSDLMSKVMAKRSLLAEILKYHGDGEGNAEKTINAVYAELGVGKDETPESLLAEACDLPKEDEADLRKVLVALLNGKKTDVEKAEYIQPWLEAPARRVESFDTYCRAFFTLAGKPREKLATKAVTDSYPEALDILQKEAGRLYEIQVRIRAARLAKVNEALLTVAADMLGRYAKHKRHTARLDFEDLIIRTSELLSERPMVQWVLYKLDEGIDHILVDEAQDTSPNQWKIVQSLSSEFFAGQGAHADAVSRTLFIVGDEKQSIFSFQGADPTAFARMQAFFGEKARDVQEGWEIFLEYSFRSTRAVLEVVDGVFRSDTARKGVVADISREVRHLPFRAGQAGLVELWPLVRAADTPEDAPWHIPTAVATEGDAASALARKIAKTIQGWRESGEILASKNRPIRAGDILILVQSRGAFVELLTRALKEADVPVAGIDRMTLTEEIAVMDLLAAAQFALQPRDDLTLATLLKSPLIGLSEEELFDLCHARPTALWPVVQKKRPDIAETLEGWIAAVGRLTPYAFFAQILNTPCPADTISGRRALYGRLGPDVHDAVDEFLNRCLHYAQMNAPSVQKFIDWFLRGEAQIKREQEAHKQDQVRIMTVHGAKGLQAPIVFLPDTVKKLHDHNRGRLRLLWPEDAEGVPLWSPRAEFEAPAYNARSDAARERQEEEYRRLLYVALTRAEDRLYVCGYRRTRTPQEDCWYNLVAQSFPPQAKQESFTIEGAEAEGDGLLRRVANPQESKPEADKRATEKSDAARAPLPDFARHPPEPEPFPAQPLSPSRPSEDEPAARGPLGADMEWKFRRGNIVHRLLEVLPQLPDAQRDAALSAYLARPGLAIPAEEQKTFAAEILAVLRDPEFAAIFGPGSRAEAPVTGIVGMGGSRPVGMNGPRPQVLSGQMDRILVTEKEVLIVDYKTNRPPPQKPENVAPIYLKQMAAYRAVIEQIYPARKVRCALLWTDGPRLMPLPDGLLDLFAP